VGKGEGGGEKSAVTGIGDAAPRSHPRFMKSPNTVSASGKLHPPMAKPRKLTPEEVAGNGADPRAAFFAFVGGAGTKTFKSLEKHVGDDPTAILKALGPNTFRIKRQEMSTTDRAKTAKAAKANGAKAKATVKNRL